jgi:hypothetical protein
LKLKQALKDAEQKKRGMLVILRNIPAHLPYASTEKVEDARAKAAIKAQIEADKKARAEKFAREKAIRDGQPIPGNSPASEPASSKPVPSTTGVAGKDYQETRLQIRMSTGGQPYTTTLRSDACESADICASSPRPDCLFSINSQPSVKSQNF